MDESPNSRPALRVGQFPFLPIDRWIGLLIQAVVIVLVCFSPWPFACVSDQAAFYLRSGAGLLAVCSAGQMLWQGEVSLHFCSLSLLLIALFLSACLQLIPLPASLVHTLAPALSELLAPLAPDRPEVLPGVDVLRSPSSPSVSETTVCAAKTRAAVWDLLWLLMIFLVLRNQPASLQSFRLLALVLVAHGTLLALFALVQSFTALPHMVYWVIPTEGAPFGPFICRNNFPDYMNGCIGLGLGLLLVEVESLPTSRGRNWMTELLHRPRLLWLTAALALMTASVVFSLSRGGATAAGGALLVCWLLRWRGGRPTPLRIVVLTGLMAVGLLAWFGLGKLEDRYATLLADRGLERGRWEVWGRVYPLARAFPWLGTGWGTFSLVEPLHRRPGDSPDNLWENAHNEYVEALVEGGVVRLALTLALVVCLLHLARASQTSRVPGEAALALGAAFGLIALALHSCVDFGVHIPAVAFLAVVLAACLARMTDRMPHRVLRLGGFGAAAVAAGLVAAALLVFREARTADRAARFVTAAGWASASSDPEESGWLEAAVAERPEDAEVRVMLGEFYFRRWRSERRPEDARAALKQFLAARSLSPLEPIPHLRLAALRGELTAGDPAIAYIERAERLRPSDPSVWYVAGTLRIGEEDADRAMACWRRSLECSDRHLPEILKACLSRMSAREVAERVVPPVPATLFRAGTALATSGTGDPGPFFRRTRELLEMQPVRSGEDWRLLARVCGELGDRAAIRDAFRSALEVEPSQTVWRLDYVEELLQQKQLAEARRQLLFLLSTRPADPRAQQLLLKVEKALAAPPGS